MMQRLFIALLAAVVFMAGYVTRMWTRREHDVPPPPPALAREFATAAPSRQGSKSGEVDRAKLVAEIEKLRPQIEAYRAQVEEIYAEFDREFVKFLNAEQRAKFDGRQKRIAESRARRNAERKPLSDEDILRNRERPLTEIYWYVTVTPPLEWLTTYYKLDPSQQTATRGLLSLRRTKFMALLDATPHPSIKLSRLAPLIERVAAPQPAQK